MKNQKLIPLFLFSCLLISTAFFSCKDDDDDTPEKAYVGEWDQQMEMDVTFDARLKLNEDATFQWIVMDPIYSHTNSDGSYDITGQQIRYFNDADCSENGIYDFTVSGTTLSLQNSSDACAGRIAALEGDWTKNEPNSWVALAGSWTKTYAASDTTFEVKLTFAENGDFSWEMIEVVPNHSNASGKFAATMEKIVYWQDTDCGDNGYYSYSIEELQLTIAVIDDLCNERTPAMVGVWEKME